jgi:hypothetical protein
MNGEVAKTVDLVRIEGCQMKKATKAKNKEVGMNDAPGKIDGKGRNPASSQLKIRVSPSSLRPF